MTSTIEQRQLKFKVWDDSNSNLGMSEPFELGECRAVFHHGPDGLMRKNIDLSMRFLQFTGLKDRKGKDIYEGDVLFARFGVPGAFGIPGAKVAARVFFSDGCFQVRVKAGKSEIGVLADFIEWLGQVEIVGNIYENSELIEAGGLEGLRGG